MNKVFMSQPDYREHPLSKSDGYHAALSELDEEYARWALSRLIDYFALSGWTMPNPPIGLPGTQPLVEDQRTRELLQFGFEYFIATIRNEPRRRLNIWNSAKNFRDEERVDAENNVLERLLPASSAKKKPQI